jgi:hypothetical protein
METAQTSRHAVCSLEISAMSVRLRLLQKLVADAHTATQNGMSEFRQGIPHSMTSQYASPIRLY